MKDEGWKEDAPLLIYYSQFTIYNFLARCTQISLISSYAMTPSIQ